jgi:alginate O-acetyltransferase complex protein AlgI
VLFPTLEFAVFFCIVLPVCWALNDRPRQWCAAMLVASLVFYGWWDARFVALILAATLLNQLAAVGIHRAGGPNRRRILIATIVADLTILGFFKYYGFFVRCGRPAAGPAAAGRHPAGGHLVLHLPGALLRHRRLPSAA